MGIAPRIAVLIQQAPLDHTCQPCHCCSHIMSTGALSVHQPANASTVTGIAHSTRARGRPKEAGTDCAAMAVNECGKGWNQIDTPGSRCRGGVHHTRYIRPKLKVQWNVTHSLRSRPCAALLVP